MNTDVPVASRPQDRQEVFWGWVGLKVQSFVASVLQQVLLGEQKERVGVEWNARGSRRCGWRNGFYNRRLLTPHGPLQVKIPRCRQGGIDCSALFDRYQRRVADVDRILRHAYLLGTSTRATAELAEQVFGGCLSHQTVSQLGRWLDDQLAVWRAAPIHPIYRVVYLDGMHLDVQGGDLNVMLVMGMTFDGQKEVLGFAPNRGEQCRELLWDLRRRGLAGVELFVSDESSAIRYGVAEVFPEVSLQHCTMHRLMNLWKDVGDKDYRWQMVKEASNIFRCPTKLAAVDQACAWAGQWRQREPWAVQQFVSDIGDSLMFYSLPKDWWRRARTNNYIERLIRTLRMRLRNMGCFYDKPAVERAVFGQLARWHLLGTYTQ
jgi:transposase-like protein